jgi:hypothetical protein
LAFLQPVLQLLPDLVYHLAYLGPVLGRHILHAFQQVGQLALLAQVCHPDLIQLFQRLGSFNLV